MVHNFKNTVASFSLLFPLKYKNEGALFIFPIDEVWTSGDDGYMYRMGIYSS